MAAKKDHQLEELKKTIQKEINAYIKQGKKSVNKAKHKKDLVEQYIKDNPWTAIGAAFLMGYIIGKIKR